MGSNCYLLYEHDFFRLSYSGCVTPLCASGADYPKNMRWQTKKEAKIKDKEERRLCSRKAGCSECPVLAVSGRSRHRRKSSPKLAVTVRLSCNYYRLPKAVTYPAMRAATSANAVGQQFFLKV